MARIVLDKLDASILEALSKKSMTIDLLAQESDKPKEELIHALLVLEQFRLVGVNGLALSITEIGKAALYAYVQTR